MWTFTIANTDLDNFSSEKDFNYLDVELKVFKKDGNKEFRLVGNIKMGQADCFKLMQVRNRLVNLDENFARGKLVLSADIDAVQSHG